MKRGEFIKHERYLDICLEILSVFDYGHGYKIKTKIWNMAYVDSYPIGQNMQLNIAKDPKDIKSSAGRNTSMKEWQILRGVAILDRCYRYSKWE